MSLKLKVNNNDHIQGSDDAPIEIVEYGDYQCSYCGEAYPVTKQLQKKLGNKLKFVFRNFPLSEIHPNALHAAFAAETADSFNNFWEMHDILYENQERLGDKFLIEYANQLGINVKKFEKDFSNPIHKNKINDDIESGLRSGVNGTPTFFINGKKFEGNPYDIDDFMSYISDLL